MERDSFVFYKSFAEALSETDADTKAQVLDALCSFALYGIEPELTGVPKALFVLMRPQIDRGIHFLEGQNGRRSSEYKAWRDDVFRRDMYTCQNCGQVGGRLNAHHIKHYATHPELRYDTENGITLCERCHREEHKTWRKAI